MKKALVGLTLFAALVGVAMPATAKAETSFSFSVSDGDYRPYSRPVYHGDGPWHHGHHRRHHDRAYWGPPPVVYAPRPVVYQQTIVQPAPRYVVNPAMVADQASPTYYNRSGQLCREYQTSGWVGGSRGQVYGTACLQPDGSWRVMD